MSEAIYTLEASVRSDKGTGASRRLRREGKVPAVLYGTDKEAQGIALSHNKVWLAQENEGFYSHILTLVIDGQNQEVILKDMQRHPFKNQVLHLDFQRVDANQSLHTNVPLHFIGEEKAAKKGGTVNHVMTELEITCLPKDLPEFIEVNVADLELGQALHISELTLPEGVTSVELSKGETHDLAVVTLHVAKKVTDEDEAAPEASDESESE